MKFLRNYCRQIGESCGLDFPNQERINIVFFYERTHIYIRTYESSTAMSLERGSIKSNPVFDTMNVINLSRAKSFLH